MKILKTITIYYLCFFLIGCTSKPPVTIQEAREMETQIIYGDSNEILKASMNVLQDMYYSIDDINQEMGHLIATKSTEGQQAEIRKENDAKEDSSLLKKILVGIFVVTIIGGLMILFFGENNNNNDNDSNHHHHQSNNVIHSNNSSDGNIFYKYKITINASDYGINETKLRVSALGEKIKGDNVIRTGPIHDTEFYNRFFSELNKELGL